MKLYLAYMGGNSKDRLIEDHEIILIAAENVEAAKEQAKNKTKLEKDVHIDMILEINNVDNYQVELIKGGEENIEKVVNYEKI